MLLLVPVGVEMCLSGVLSQLGDRVSVSVSAVVAAGVQPAVAEPRGIRQGRTYAYEPSELLQLHQPIPVSVVLGEHLGRLGMAQVEPEVAQRGPQLAVVEVPAAVAVEPLEARADRPVDWWLERPPGAVR